MKRLTIFYPSRLNLFLITACFALCQNIAFAAEDSPFSGGVSVGIEHNNRLSVQDIDTISNKSDHATLIDLDLNYDVEITPQTELALSYSFSQSFHDEFEEFDLRSHFLSADLKHEFADFDAGLAYRFIDTALDNDSFLDLQQISPYISKFIGEKVFVRFDYTYTDKDFDEQNTRDADTHSGAADVYYFIDGTNTYLIVGYKYKDEDTKDAQFDYDSHTAKIKFVKKIALGDYLTKLKAGWRFESRDYSSVTGSIGEKRDDIRRQYNVEWEIPFTSQLSGVLEYTHSINSSNLPSVDYSQDLISASIAYEF
jgi:hypothetical protein